MLGAKYANVSLLDRLPQAMWRGRTKDKIYPHRDHLRCGYSRAQGLSGWADKWVLPAAVCILTAQKGPCRAPPGQLL